jgi:hypothetical protein
LQEEGDDGEVPEKFAPLALKKQADCDLVEWHGVGLGWQVTKLEIMFLETRKIASF